MNKGDQPPVARRRRVARSLLVPLLGLTAVLSSATLLSADDFWVIPNAFALAEGSMLELRGQTSSLFPTSKSAVAVDRIADAWLINDAGRVSIAERSIAGSSLMLRHRLAGRGQHLVAVAISPRTVRETPASFRRYMRLEGAPEAIVRYEREGRLPPATSPDSLTRRYAKFSKSFIQVGVGGARAFQQVAGHPLEFIPMRDPAAMAPGDTLPVRILLHGRPLANARVHAGFVEWTPTRGLPDSAAARRSSAHDRLLTSDDAGVIHIAVDHGGLWNLRGIHILPAESGSGADWDVYWATMVFQPKSDVALTPAGRDARDSSAVADVVRRYGNALSTGDSTAVLSMLAPDALILESGGSESREEYRSHHLPGDIAYARSVRTEDSAVRVIVSGDVAWATSTSVTTGTYRGRAVNATGAELMVLTRGRDGQWRIRAIHWSSRPRSKS